MVGRTLPRDWKVDPVNPPPRQKLSEGTAEHWSESSHNGPGYLKKAKKERSSAARNINDAKSSRRVCDANLVLNKSEMAMLIREIKPPPDTPWRVRPTMSLLMLLETAHMIELAKYRATVISRIGFRPHMSDYFAHIGMTAVVAMKYEAPIQE